MDDNCVMIIYLKFTLSINDISYNDMHYLFILVAKDSHNPTMLKLVLQALSSQWQIDVSELTSQNTSNSQPDSTITKGVSRQRGKTQRISISLATSCEHRGKTGLFLDLRANILILFTL